MTTEKIKKLLDMASEAVNEDSKVVKTIKVKPEWKEQFEALHATADEMRAKLDEMITDRNMLWATIEKESKTFGKNLTYNEEKQVIEVRES